MTCWIEREGRTQGFSWGSQGWRDFNDVALIARASEKFVGDACIGLISDSGG